MNNLKNFDEFLNESLWADVQSQASGETMKKEDDVNRLDIDGLIKYLNKNYDASANIWKGINSRDRVEYVYIPICENKHKSNVHIFFDFPPNNILSIEDGIMRCVPDIYKKLKDRYNITRDEYLTNLLIISPKHDKKVDNQYLIEVLDFIINNDTEGKLTIKRKYVNESLWADVQSQASGETEKKEDFMSISKVSDGDLEYIYKYFISHYDPTGDTFIGFKRYPDDTMELCVPISRGDTSMFLIDNEEYDPNDPGELRMAILPKQYVNKMDRRYCDFTESTLGWNSIRVYFSGDLKNHDTVYFIESLWENVPDPAYVKKKGLKESLWADVQNQASGDTVKKEDSVDLMGPEKFCDYLHEKYVVKNDAINKRYFYYNKKVDRLSVPVVRYDGQQRIYTFTLNYWYTENTIRFTSYMLWSHDVGIKDELEKRFNIKVFKRYEWHDDPILHNYDEYDEYPENDVILIPEEGKEVNNSLFIELLDFFIDNVKDFRDDWKRIGYSLDIHRKSGA